MPYNLTEQPEIDEEIEVPEGTDIVSRGALIAVVQNLANRTRNLMNRLGGRTGASNWEYLDELGAADPKSRMIELEGSSLLRGSSSTHYTKTSSGVPTVYVQSIADGGWFMAPMVRRLCPRGSTITTVRARVQAGAARGSVSDRITLRVQVVGIGTETATDNGSAGFHDIEVTGAFPSEDLVSIAVRTGADTDLDVIQVIEIEYTTPGPMD